MINLSEKTAGQISSRIDYKFLGLIAVLAVGYQISLYTVERGGVFGATDVLYLTGLMVCIIFSFLVSNRYRGSQIFGRAYFFLGLGLISWFVADVYYYYAESIGIDPWPSPFDWGFMASYVFAGLHLVLNTRYFKRKWSIPMKLWLVGFPLAVVATYTLLAYEAEWDNFDLYYGMPFAIGASAIFALAVLGASVFRQSVLGPVWLLLAIGIFLWAIADVWYVYLEIFEEFDNDTHVTNTIWMTSFMVMSYALYKHLKTL